MESAKTPTSKFNKSNVTERIIRIKKFSGGASDCQRIDYQQIISSHHDDERKNEIKDDGKDDKKSDSIYCKNKFEQEALDRHNQYRSKHDCPKLVLSKEMCDYAQEWAHHLAQTGSFQHRPLSNRKYGENLFMKSGTNISINGHEAVDQWYNEIRMYNFCSPKFDSNTGHFTQVVWRDSKRMGIAYAKHGSSIYVVANYDPPGNFMGRFQENVPPKKES